MTCRWAPAAMVLLCSLAGSADASTIYTLNDPFGPNASLTGTITTDGAIGALTQADITAFDLTVTVNGASGTITNLNNIFSSFLVGSAVSASANGLSFDFSANGKFQIYNGSFEFFACGTGNLCTPNNDLQLVMFSPNFTDLDFPQDGQTVQFASATPLPAALPLFASGLGALGLLGWRKKRKAAALAA